RHLDPKERLLAGAVAREDQALATVGADGEAEHTVEPPDGVGPESLVQRDDGLDVARGPERVPGADPLLAQLPRVVDLAVAHHPDGSVGILKRLIAGGEVHDREATSADAGALVTHDALAVRATVREGGGHGGDAVRVSEGIAGERDSSKDATHYRTLPPPRGGWGGREEERARQGPYAAA